MNKLRSDLLTLLPPIGPSGYERDAAAAWRELAALQGEVETDPIGNSYAVFNRGGSPRVTLVGHIDEIGFIVKYIDDLGMCWIEAVGTWDPVIVPGQRVLVRTDTGTIQGVIGKLAPHLLSAEEMSKAPKIEELWVDVGAESADEARSLVSIGDPLVLDGAPLELRAQRLSSRAMDNRVGSLVALEAAARAAKRVGNKAEIVAVAAVREEISYAGAATAAFSRDPAFSITIDVTHTCDLPNSPPQKSSGAKLGGGPVISRGAGQHEGVTNRLRSLAKKHKIPVTLDADGSTSWTDSEATHQARGGIPSGLVSVPLRYMHSPCETVDLRDVDQAIELVAQFCASLKPGEELT